MSATRLYEWHLHTDQPAIDLMEAGDCVPVQRTSVVELGSWWPCNAWQSLGGHTTDHVHMALAEGEALVAAARAGLYPMPKIAGNYKLCKTRVTFYAGGVFSIGRTFATVAGPKGEAVTRACRLYPTSPLATAWLIARDDCLERGLVAA